LILPYQPRIIKAHERDLFMRFYRTLRHDELHDIV
jgi:hypothetical protein